MAKLAPETKLILLFAFNCYLQHGFMNFEILIVTDEVTGKYLVLEIRHCGLGSRIRDMEAEGRRN